MKEPDFPFKKIYKKEVYLAEKGQMADFPPCKDNAAEVEFRIEDIVQFDFQESIVKNPIVIFNFENV